MESLDTNGESRHEDIYLPWLFFIKFLDFDHFLEIEGDFDGSLIKINLYNNSQLESKLKENHLPNEPDLWSVYDTKRDEKLGQLLGKEIDFIEFGIDKDEFEINHVVLKGSKEYFNYIRFLCGQLNLTIFEGSVTGLRVSDDKNIKLHFEETFETYSTK